MPWFSLQLSQQDLAQNGVTRLKQEFRAILNEIEANRCLAMYQDAQEAHQYFIACDAECQLLYALIQFYNGIECLKPDLEDLLYLDGHYDDHMAENVE